MATYKPSNLPDTNELADVISWLRTEMDLIRQAMPGDILTIPILNAAPVKPRNGMLVYADGTNWNPGSGAGFYGRQGGSWVKL